MDFSQKIKISIFWGPPRGKKTESIFELVENINQEMKLFVDFFKKKLDLSFLATMEKKRVNFWVWKKPLTKVFHPYSSEKMLDLKFLRLMRKSPIQRLILQKTSTKRWLG